MATSTDEYTIQEHTANNARGKCYTVHSKTLGTHVGIFTERSNAELWIAERNSSVTIPHQKS